MDAVRRRIEASPLLLDALIALALTGLSVVTLLAGARDIGSYSPISIALLFTQTVPLVARRAAPVPVFLITAVATIAHAALAEGSLNTTLGSLIMLFTVAETQGRRVSAMAAIGLGAAMGALIAYRAGVPGALGALVQTELAVTVSYVLGIWARERRAYVGTVEQRAARAELEREERAYRAVVEERERIARELHDVVTHHVSVIVIQAGAARRALERRPADARVAIDAIDETGRQALGDMRRMLGILGGRDGGSERDAAGDGAAGGDVALEPMPGLARLGSLLESVRAAGLPVELSIEGDARPLDPGVELSAYRIVQEALTNTLKHARGARAHVRLLYEASALDVFVTDEGGHGSRRLARAGDGGRGLIGMRERVALFGGSLDAGPAGSGFRIRARLPFDAPTVNP